MLVVGSMGLHQRLYVLRAPTCIHCIADGLMHGSGGVGGIIAGQSIRKGRRGLKAHRHNVRQVVRNHIVDAADQAGHRTHACEVQDLRTSKWKLDVSSIVSSQDLDHQARMPSSPLSADYMSEDSSDPVERELWSD